MIYIYYRKNATISNYLCPVDRMILTWADNIQECYQSLILHRLKMPKNWKKSHTNRYQYKNLLDLKTKLIKEDNIILLHPPEKVEDVYQLVQDPNLRGKDFWLFGLEESPHRLGYQYDLSNFDLEYQVVDNLEGFLNSLSKTIVREKKLDQLFNI